MKLIVRKVKEPPVPKTSNPVIVGKIGGDEILCNVRPNEKVNMDDLLCAAEKIRQSSVDDLVPVKFCEVTPHDSSYDLNFVGCGENESTWKATMSEYALAQLGFRYGIPSSYIKRCTLVGMTGLTCENFNRWLDYDNGKVLIRRYSEDDESYVRGVLSTRYTRYDMDLILRDVARSRISDWEIRQYLLSPERFHLRLVSGEKLNVAGEDLEIAVNVDSSDIGRNSLNLRIIIFRQICSNGMILPYSVGNLYRQVHKGVGAEQFPNRIAATLESIPEIKRQAEEMIKRTMGQKLPFNIEDEEAGNRFRQASGIPKDFLKKVIEMYKARQLSERWGFINCMTEVAQEYGIDTRLDLERAAGSLLVAA